MCNLFLSSISNELKTLNQWCVAGANKAPLYLSPTGGLVNANVNNPTTWMPFDTASQLALKHKFYLGFVLTAQDPFCCIDIDVVNETTQQLKNQAINTNLWTKPTDYKRFNKIISAFDSHTEISCSGQGMHIWVKGNIGSGCRRDGIEVYSQQRFIICTGHLHINKPIENRQTLLNQLVTEIRQQQGIGTIDQAPLLVEVPPVKADDAIWRIATIAKNAPKFIALCKGQWGLLNYPSQSEADFALMAMLAFYSPSNSQCLRLFKKTVLGSRDKANDKYLDGILLKIRAKQAQEKQEIERLKSSLFQLVTGNEATNKEETI